MSLVPAASPDQPLAGLSLILGPDGVNDYVTEAKVVEGRGGQA